LSKSKKEKEMVEVSILKNRFEAAWERRIRVLKMGEMSICHF
jgi:hypothetical protein